jgi:superfamily II DNA or RNA helicase
MRTQLYNHNKTAYQKVMRAFETADRTCVVHPTGTGKSYLIAAVSESFNRVLILGPNTFVLDQVHSVLKWRKRGVEYMTYQTLNLTENPHTDYDLICLDEFHRAGAQEWGAAVDRLLELNNEAKVFGTTATHIRYLDNERNMADELFGGNIASHITIAEAWNQNILPIPRYVSGLFRWDNTVSEAQERIERSRSLSDKEKRERIFRLSNAKLRWELSYGMPAILKKHLDRDASRVIVFCGNIESLGQMHDEVVGWFRKAGFTVVSTCIMHSDLTDREQREQMDRFEDDTDGKGVKLMFSVNMLNEGVHVPNVNAVLMLRTTSSRIIYMQQMGRCLTAANTQKPLVLDMVDNITTTTAIKGLLDEFEILERETADSESREPRKFEVKDYTLGVRDLIEKLVPPAAEVVPFEERLARAADFCEKYGRPPGRYDGKEEYNNWHYLVAKFGDTQEVMVLREKYGRWFGVQKEERMKRLVDFCETNHRLPAKREKEEYSNYAALRSVLSGSNDDAGTKEQFKALYEKYGPYRTFEDRLVQLQRFVDANDRLPMEADGKDEYLNYRQIRRLNSQLKNPSMTAIIVKYDPRTVEEVKQAILDFHAEHGRLPMSDHGTAAEKSLYSKMEHRARELFKYPEMIALRQRRLAEPLERKILRMQEFTEKHGRKPLKSEKGYHVWQNMLKNGREDPRVKAMYESYSDDPKVNMNNYIAPLVEFVCREHRPPMAVRRDERHLYNIYAHIRSKYSFHPDVAALLSKITALNDSRPKAIDTLLDKVEAFANEHGHLPSISKYSSDEEKTLARNWYDMAKRHYGHLPRVKEINKKYPTKHRNKKI